MAYTKLAPAPCVGTIAELWDNIIKGGMLIQMMKNGLDEGLWREKEKLALA